MIDVKKLLFQKSNNFEEIATRQKLLLCRTSYSEALTALKKYLLWRSRSSENAVILKKFLNMGEEASSFEKKQYSMPYFYTVSTYASYC